MMGHSEEQNSLNKKHIKSLLLHIKKLIKKWTIEIDYKLSFYKLTKYIGKLTIQLSSVKYIEKNTNVEYLQKLILL